MYVDPESCIECGSCETACPNGAIMPERRLDGPWVDFAWVDAAWFSDPDAARSVVDELVPAA
jgi:ferredoxin--NADP+ reductase